MQATQEQPLRVGAGLGSSCSAGSHSMSSVQDPSGCARRGCLPLDAAFLEV